MSDRLSPLMRLARPARTDRDLLRAYLAGQTGAFDELVRRHRALARRAAAEVCPTAADDIAQSTLALLAKKAAAVSGRESAAGWVFETARRLALKARIADTRRTARERKASPPTPPTDPLDALTLREVRAAVAEELARLPDAIRLPLVLCYWDGADRPTAAARLGCSVSTLKRRLNDGRDRLAARLARRGFAGPAVVAALAAVQAGAEAAPVIRSAGLGLGRWAGLATVAATIIAFGIGVHTSTPVAADPPGPGAKPAAKPPAEPPAAAARDSIPPAVIAAPPVDRYGDPLPIGAVARLGTVRFRHGGQVLSVAYSPDGKMIASGGYGRIMLWEADTGKPLGSLVRMVDDPSAPGKFPDKKVEHGHTFGLAFTLDGKWLLSAGSPSVAHDRGHVVFWDVGARKWHTTTEHLEARPTQWMRALVMSSDGQTAAAGSDAGKLFLIDVKEKTMRPAKVELPNVAGLSFSKDGKALAVATFQGVILINPATGAETIRLPTGKARQVAFAPDGKSVWVGCDGGDPFGPGQAKPGTVSRWDIEKQAKAQSFAVMPDMLLAIAVSPDGKRVAVGGVNYGPYLWDVDTAKPALLDQGGPRIRPWVQGLVFAPDSKTLASADSNGRVRVWDVATYRELHRQDEHENAITRVAVSPDGKQVATAGGDGTVRIWDAATWRTVRTWKADEVRSVFSVAFTPDGRQVLTAGWGGFVRLWDVATGTEGRRFRDGKTAARAALSPDGKLVAATAADGDTIVLSETATGRKVREITGHVSDVMNLAFTPDGRRLVSTADMHSDGQQTFDDCSLRVWDVATGKQLHKFDGFRPGSSPAATPDGRVVAMSVSEKGAEKGSVRFWDLATGKEIEDWRVREMRSVAFSPDGRLVAMGDRMVRLVETASGKELQAFDTGAGPATGLTFTPDGRRLISAHDDGTALVWDLALRAPPGIDRAKAWDDLSSPDTAPSRRAMASLVSHPGIAVELLTEKLKPVPKPPGLRTTAALIADLDAEAFGVREAASRVLTGRVAAEFGALSVARDAAKSEEVRQRLTAVLQSAPSPWPRLEADELRAVRAVAVLEAVGTPEARRLLRALAEGDPYARMTWEAKAAVGRLGPVALEGSSPQR